MNPITPLLPISLGLPALNETATAATVAIVALHERITVYLDISTNENENQVDFFENAAKSPVFSSSANLQSHTRGSFRVLGIAGGNKIAVGL